MNKKNKVVFRATARKYRELSEEARASSAALEWYRQNPLPEGETEEQRRQEDHRHRKAWWRLRATKLTARARARLGFKTPSRAAKAWARLAKEQGLDRRGPLRSRRAVFRVEN